MLGALLPHSLNFQIYQILLEAKASEQSARMVAMNVVRAILLEAAAQHGQDPMTLSFVHALRAILAFSPILATAPIWKLPTIYQAMLHEIACHRVPRRPGRLERHRQALNPLLL